MAVLIEATGLTRRHDHDGGAVVVLDNVDLRLAEGEFVTVMGPSGSGKSTLLHCMSGLDRPSAGTVRLGGVDLFALSERQRTLARRRHLGFVFQFFNLLPDLTVEENVTLPLLIAGDAPAHHAQRLEELYAALELTKLLRRQPHDLSGGEMQRVSVARALAARPPALFADEPTGNLATKAGEETMRLLRSVRDRFGTAVLLVTHNPRDAAFGDRVFFLKDGLLDPSQCLEGPDLDASTVFSRLEELGI